MRKKEECGLDRKLYALVPSEWDGRKLKDFLRAKWHLSASLLIVLKQRSNGICLNGTPVTVNTLLSKGDQVVLSVGDDGVDSYFEETPMDLEILYEDSDLLVLNKPPFLPVHPSKGHVNDTLANGITHYYHQKGETFVSRCVLRLDANTSGAVLFAKNAYAHDRLRCQLNDGLLQKEYYAIVHGKPRGHGTIDAPIYNPPKATVKREIHPLGKPSRTEYFTEKENGALSLLRVLPQTGRTHQIRLHLSHIGHPIVSDFLYGDEHDGILTRHGLHCSKLTFLQPVTGKEITVKAPLAPDMAAVVQSMALRLPYRSLDGYVRETFGEKLVKISLNAGLSCPNRLQGRRGCSFCSAGGSGEFAGTPQKSIEKQLADGKQLLSRKWKNCRYIAYFQAFTNTYGPVATLRRLYEQALADPDVAVLSIATRPDCLPDDVLDLLEECNRKKPVWVELGLQTAKDSTAHRFNRGYDRSAYESAVQSLHRRNISVITHLIFGLPDESRADMLESVRSAAKFTDGIKLQMLQILKGSVWAEEYGNEPFPLLSQEEYISLVCDAVSLLPPSVVVHRLTGDPPADLLIAPQWTLDKKRILAEIQKRLKQKMLLD